MHFAYIGLVSSLIFSKFQTDSGLFQALRDAGASKFAQAIQEDAGFLNLIAAGEVGTLYAPTDSPAAAKFLVREVPDDALITISGSDAILLEWQCGVLLLYRVWWAGAQANRPVQARYPIQNLSNLKTNKGTVIDTLANITKPNGEHPVQESGNSSGLIHIVDTYFTVPRALSTSAATLGLTTFNTLSSSLNLGNASSITTFIPSNEALAAANTSQPNVRSLVVHEFPQHFPVLEDGARLVTDSGSTLTVTRRGIDVFVNGAKITKPNVILENGVAPCSRRGPTPSGSSQSPLVTGPGVRLVSH
ncbi:hypothetical protein B0H67DRAFT_557212 [Lasiosphaeris hirsuta]|uniref:FAS1 domain-containing protein n=1 Tax=Lasiosphaeris hirsuta TaxID=260670 RepID=A0AA40DI44_9PEZI|nr:hypothetical protein B0H67DRAFT_557212 [Lasiosphaeris hirsuta]